MDEGRAPIASIAAAIRRHREAGRWSLAEVARRAGIAKSTLSQLEAGAGNPSVETMWALATALEVPLAVLLDPPRPTVVVVRADEGEVIRTEDADYAGTLLSHGAPDAARDIYRITFEPGRPRRAAAH